MTADLIIHHWLVDPDTASLIHKDTGEQRRLGEYQLKLLQVLARHAGQTLTREELTTLVWEGRVIGNNSLPNAIHALRLALEDNGKQQRIIKTIPKKGYILETEFCHWATVSTASTDITAITATNEETVTNTPSTTEISLAKHAEVTTTKTSRQKKPSFWRWLVPLQLLLLLALSLLIAKHLFTRPPTKLLEENSAVYSNIRIAKIQRGWDNIATTERVSKQLGPVFFELNQQLQNKQAMMNIFFYSADITLKYTFSLQSACDHRQLAMNILNWRTDEKQLSALIYRESERKINEMANCITQPAGHNAVTAADR